MRIVLILFSIIFLFSCNSNETVSDHLIHQDDRDSTKVIDTSETAKTIEKDKVTANDNAEATYFSTTGFTDKKYYELLIETRLCNPDFESGVNVEGTPCSARFFKFFSYNHKRKIDDAFLIQLKAGVNDYPYRRLLIFVREEGQLVLMNGIVGYLVERIPQDNEIDDLVVAIIDDLGNDKFDRYDVLLRYENGKYHFVEAIGDLEGEFKNPDLKKAATKAIHERIIEKNLIF